MKILDVLTAPWAIQPEKLTEIQNIYATHLRGDKIDISAVEKRLGRPLANEQTPYQVIDGVALIEATGVMAKRMNLFMEISGGASMQLIGRDVQTAKQDPNVHSIIMLMDSPGGTVDGTQSLADIVASVRGIKPIVALCDGEMCSAAYWVGSSVDKIYISSETNIVGSIGVVAQHVDTSGMEAQKGIKTTDIFAGKYKRIASNTEPLSQEGREYMQDYVDYLYSIFVSAVAANRGTTEEIVLSNMADGRVFVGQRAIDAGLVDGVSTLDDLIYELNASRAGSAQPKNSPTSISKGSKAMDITQLRAEHPDLAAALLAEGASAESSRIQGVLAQSVPGHEALIQTLAFDGRTTGPEAAVQIIAADRKLSADAAGNLGNNAPAPAKFSAAPAEDDHSADELPLAERAKATWDKDASIRSEFSSFETYLAYATGTEGNSVKVLGAHSTGKKD